VLNTCSVRQKAEDRAVSKLGLLRRLKAQRNGGLKIAVMGCMVGLRSQHLQERFPFVDVFARPQAFADVLAAVLPQEDLGGEFWPSTFAEPTGPTAFVPVIHGCNKFCTFCIVPYRRGRERSRPIAEVAHEVEVLADRGVREVTLLGQTVEAGGQLGRIGLVHLTAHRPDVIARHVLLVECSIGPRRHSRRFPLP